MSRPSILRVAALVALLGLPVSAEDYFVSVSTGKGKDATKEAPAKDIGNVASRLKPGDTINLAGGVYPGKADSGCDELTVPVKIVGGWDTAFTKRDPWGATRTVLSGDNKSKNFSGGARLEVDLQKFKGAGDVVIDGNAVEADVKAAEGRVNEWRKMLGLPQQAGDVKADSDIWLHKLALDGALQLGAAKYAGKFGCAQPAAK